MLSILIPTYNYDCQGLVDALNVQARELGVQYEIIVFDDTSTERFEFRDCRVIRSERNVGRAAGRNALARAARFEYLLYIDSDSMPARGDYLRRYVERIERKLQDAACRVSTPQVLVISGGRVYRKAEDVEHSLLPAYGRRERVVRECQPMAPFMSPNFLIDRATMLAHPFDESFRGYGHEDTLFGIELMLAGIRYTVIDNPVVHCHIETNAEFLRKNREALRTLKKMAEGRDGVGCVCTELRQVSKMVRWSRFVPFRLPMGLAVLMEKVILRWPTDRLLQVYKFLYYNAL